MGSLLLTMQLNLHHLILSVGLLVPAALGEQAPYKIIQKFNGFGERSHPSIMWVCTSTGGFMSLFRYISGNNDENQKIDMTAPVMNTASEKGIETCFYLPKEFQSNPPTPTGRGVYLSKKRARNVYAMRKTGFPNIEQEVQRLQETLERSLPNKVDFSAVMWIGYDRYRETADVMFNKI